MVKTLQPYRLSLVICLADGVLRRKSYDWIVRNDTSQRSIGQLRIFVWCQRRYALYTYFEIGLLDRLQLMLSTEKCDIDCLSSKI